MVVLPLVALALHAASATAAVSLHLFPSTDTKHSDDASWTDITSVLAHANGASRLFRWSDSLLQDNNNDQIELSNILHSDNVKALKPDIFTETTGSLIMLVAGLDEQNIPLPVAFSSSAFTPIKAVSDYLTHFTELVSSEHVTERANMISISSVCNDEVRSIPGVSRLVLKKDSALVTIPDSATSAFKSQVKEIAKSAYENVQSTFDAKFGESPLQESEK
ncbi:hypothetical protein HDU98_009844, partial [Podochytrium sp. JEL0797]